MYVSRKWDITSSPLKLEIEWKASSESLQSGCQVLTAIGSHSRGRKGGKVETQRVPTVCSFVPRPPGKQTYVELADANMASFSKALYVCLWWLMFVSGTVRLCVCVSVCATQINFTFARIERRISRFLSASQMSDSKTEGMNLGCVCMCVCEGEKKTHQWGNSAAIASSKGPILKLRW